MGGPEDTFLEQQVASWAKGIASSAPEFDGKIHRTDAGHLVVEMGLVEVEPSYRLVLRSRSLDVVAVVFLQCLWSSLTLWQDQLVGVVIVG